MLIIEELFRIVTHCFHRYETGGEPCPPWVACSCQLSPRWDEPSGREKTGCENTGCHASMVAPLHKFYNMLELKCKAHSKRAGRLAR